MQPAFPQPSLSLLPVAALQDRIQGICGKFEVEPMRQRPVVRGDARAAAIGRFETAFVSLDAKAVSRTARSIRQDPGEHLFLLVQDQGACSIHQGETPAHLTPGDMHLIDSVRPSTFVYNGMASRQISFHLPRDEMRRRFGDVCLGGVRIRPDSALPGAIRLVIGELAAGCGASAFLDEALLNLLGAYFHSLSSGNGDGDGVKLLARALRLIEQSSGDPDFGPRRLACELDVSARTLQRHFRALGQTPGQRLLNARLENARRRLIAVQRTRSPVKVSQVAFACGFNDLSYFYREFRRRYGVAPGAARADDAPVQST